MQVRLSLNGLPIRHAQNQDSPFHMNVGDTPMRCAFYRVHFTIDGVAQYRIIIAKHVAEAFAEVKRRWPSAVILKAVRQ